MPDREDLKQQLEEGFELEWNLLRPYLINKNVSTIYFGGGTPFLFGPKRIAKLLRLIQNTCSVSIDAEVTLEANPENITFELMQEYAVAGINRVSIGIQTLDTHLLTLLGRLHNPKTALQAIHTTYQAGIHNISIDLMYDLPDQTLEHWKRTLSHISSLPISHLSLYNLTIEPHTVFFKNQTSLRPLLPKQEESLAMYEMAIETLEKNGLPRYEISAFAKPNFESKHNTGYWIARPFLGLGPSAFSYWAGSRFRNISHLSRYHHMLQKGQFPRDFEEKLNEDAHRRELFVIQLRMLTGLDIQAFNLLHGALDEPTQKIVKSLIENGFLHLNQNRIQLTQKGILFYDTIAVELI